MNCTLHCVVIIEEQLLLTLVKLNDILLNDKKQQFFAVHIDVVALITTEPTELTERI
jgi:hypothetical protein